jgi:glycosyltransferase involved in cell wall biosynthesis
LLFPCTANANYARHFPAVSVRTPDLSVVVATRNRAQRLRALLRSLSAQTIEPAAFEAIVVDDASLDETASVLADACATSPFGVRAIRRSQVGGPGRARNDGWREARGGIVAFIDDDCIATPGWLEAGLASYREDPGVFVQGRTTPIPEEQPRLGLFSYTITVEHLGPHFETCNIFYPRDLLERHGGFDTEAFPRGGEDCDLAWRVIESGVRPRFAPEATVYHAVHELGPIGQLRRAAHWSDTMLVFARHPGMREAFLQPDRWLNKEMFWQPQHRFLAFAMAGLLLPGRLRWLRATIMLPYFRNLIRHRLPDMGVSPWLAPYVFLLDLVEMGAVIRGALRFRTLVI